MRAENCTDEIYRRQSD